MILVIEDEAALRDVLSEILEISDIPALCTANGEDGISAFSQNQDLIQAVFLDMKLPGIGGKATFEQLRAIDPTIPIIIMSGRPEHVTMAEFEDKMHLAYLEKPFTLDAIIAKVDNVLNAA